MNPSYEAVRLLPETIGEHRITKLELPVTFEGTPPCSQKRSAP
ncbi:MAG: hypothetical protein ACLR2E_16420 [Lachnospiraceae bacterium]